jgi:propanol-preferring alcohol dehydrogenase
VSYVNHVTPIPAGIGSAAAASILCAGVTTYRALKHSGAQHGDWLVLPGAGGGLGHLALQYARTRGLRVIAIDTGPEKRALCEKLGAEVWVDFKETEDIVKAIRAATGGPGAHVALVAAATAAAYQLAIDYLRPGGTLMVVGLPGEAKLEASIFFTVFKASIFLARNTAPLLTRGPQSISILGSCVGNRQDAIEAIDIAARGEVKVHFELKGLSALKEYAVPSGKELKLTVFVQRVQKHGGRQSHRSRCPRDRPMKMRTA